MAITVTLEWRGDQFVSGLVEPACADGLNAAAAVLETSAKKNIVPRPSPSLSSRIPPALGRGKGWVSGPGQSPTTQLGVLRNSIRTWRASAKSLVASVGTLQSYGRHLEYGTSKMAPRPWLAPSVQQSKNRMQLAFVQSARARMRTSSAA